jgi:protein-histidine pros-kinase
MSEDEYVKLLVEETPDALIATAPDGKIEYWSRGAASTFGYTAEEAVGHFLYELVLPVNRGEEQREIAREVLEAGTSVRESVQRRKDGSLIYISMTAHAVRNAAGEVERFVTAMKDVTHLRAMRDSKLVDSRYRQLLEDAPDAIVIVNDTGRMVFFNKQAEEVFGYQRSEMLGEALEILLPERYRGGHVAHRVGYFSHSRTRPMGAGLELQGLRKDGREFPVEISLSPLETENGRLACSFIRDITERKRFERSLQETNRLKSEFLASMSHELRTPLNGIIGFTEFLVDERPGALNAKQKEYLMDVYNSAQHLLKLINDVLDLAKVEAGKIELNPVKFPVAKAIGEVCAVINGVAHKRQVAVRTMVAEDLGSVMLDEQKFKQICFNLLANAVKFSEEGGTVEVGARRMDGVKFELWVKDAGIGIKQEDMKRLFREFEQIEGGAARRYEGTGLGLALTKKLVEYQGGSIGAQSEWGKGSTFTAILPVICERRDHE